MQEPLWVDMMSPENPCISDVLLSGLSSNIILILLAISVAAAAIGLGCIAAHPNRFLLFIRELRKRSWLARIETGYRGLLAILFPAPHCAGQASETPYSAAVKLPECGAPIKGDISSGIAPATTLRQISQCAGLSESEVNERIARGQINVTTRQTSRTVGEILKANFFTRFNFLLGSLWVVIIFVSPAQDALFGIVAVLNTAIGIVQELRAKWTLDRLVLITAPKARVIRSGKVVEVTMDKIVMDDIIELRGGDQVPVDGIVLHSDNGEVDESLLTGESEPALKKAGDEMYSSSFMVAGSCRIQAVHVGEQAYARRLANAARRFELARSELREGINDILRYITWFLVPTGLMLLISQLLCTQGVWRNAVAGSVAGVVGMVPQGLVLLTSVVMAAAVVRLAQRGALIHELAAVELLARVDVLCLDKTGTLTEGKMVLEQIIPMQSILGADAIELSCDPKGVLGAFAKAEPNPNASLLAIAAACTPWNGDEWTVKSAVPFSSARKWSAVTFSSHGTWVFGAPGIVLKVLGSKSPLWAEIDLHARKGKRVLALAHTENRLPKPTGSQSISLPPLIPAALVILSEQMRREVTQTLRYFEDQGVMLKVISGDNPLAVAAIAGKAGVDGADFPQDGRNLPEDLDTLGGVLEEYSVFGRVTPEQKRLMVKALQARGHVVAMTGDGVNDVLAIKDADFGIAMGSGADACRAVAQLILLSNNFAVLPSVIAEGRQVIANIEHTANLFITKTAYVFGLALAVALAQVPFPLLPRHVTLVGMITIGPPALFLALSRNIARARRGFVSRVLRLAIPAGGFAAAATLIAYAITRQIAPMDVDLARTASTFTLIGCGLSVPGTARTASQAFSAASRDRADCCTWYCHCQPLV